MSKLGFARCLALAALCGAVACDDDDDASPDASRVDVEIADGPRPSTGGDAGAVPPTADAATADARAAAALADPQIAGAALEANRGEVAAGEVGAARAVLPAVKAFAQRMVTEHGAASARLTALLTMAGIAPAESDASRELARQAQTAVMLLSSRTGAQFDEAYVSTQVQMHAMVRDLLDRTLIPGAQNAALKAELMAMRQTVAAHLAEAQALGTRAADAGARD